MVELFQINDSKTSKVKKVERLSTGEQSNFSKEKVRREEGKLQKLFEANLEEILGIEYIASERAIGRGRIDTIGIDNDGAPCIIEFKFESGDEAFSQVLAYRKSFQDNKYNFKDLCHKKGIGEDKIDWNSLRVLIIAKKYSHRITSIASDYKVELLTYHIYNEKFLCLNSVGELTQSKTRKKKQNISSQKQNSYSIKDHLAGKDKQIGKLFRKSQSKILGLENVAKEVKKRYIAYKYIADNGSTNVVAIEIQRGGLKVGLNVQKGKLNDPQGLVQDFSNIGNFANANYMVTITNESQLEEVFPFILQSYNINKAKVKAKKSKK